MFVMLSRSKLIDIQYLTLPIAKKGLRKERFVFKYFNDAEPQLFPKYIFSQLTDRIREEKKMKSKKNWFLDNETNVQIWQKKLIHR